MFDCPILHTGFMRKVALFIFTSSTPLMLTLFPQKNISYTEFDNSFTEDNREWNTKAKCPETHKFSRGIILQQKRTL